MRFALLGSHPDGLALADSLLATGRHELIAYTAAPPGAADRWGAAGLRGDLEEVLADPAVEAVIVAGTPVNRPQQLRRALQSERHVGTLVQVVPLVVYWSWAFASPWLVA